MLVVDKINKKSSILRARFIYSIAFFANLSMNGGHFPTLFPFFVGTAKITGTYLVI